MKLQSTFNVCLTLCDKCWEIEVENYKTMCRIFVKRLGWAHWRYEWALRGKDYKNIDALDYVRQQLKELETTKK